MQSPAEARVLVHRCVAVVSLLALNAGASAQSCNTVGLGGLVPQNAVPGDWSGFSIAADNDLAVAGAMAAGPNGAESGSATVYRFDGFSWVEFGTLLPSDGAPGDGFGRSVAISGGTAVVGAWKDDDNGPQSGSAYVFRFDGTQWVQEAKLVASDGEAVDYFGWSVAIDDDLIVVGAEGDDDNGDHSGSAYVFRRSGTTWTETKKLQPNDAANADGFGNAVSIWNETVLIGSWGDTQGGSRTGSAYVFAHDGSEWAEQGKLVPDDTGGQFGQSVALFGWTAVVGAARDDDQGIDSGSATIFQFDGSQWNLNAKLLASDGGADRWFGRSVAFDGSVILVGASLPNGIGPAPTTGSAYVYRSAWPFWYEQAVLTNSGGAHDDLFGSSVALTGDGYAFVGAYLSDSGGADAGETRVFNINCPIELTCDGVVDSGDLQLFITLFLGGEPGADLNDDGVVDSGDLQLFIAFFQAGC